MLMCFHFHSRKSFNFLSWTTQYQVPVLWGLIRVFFLLVLLTVFILRVMLSEVSSGLHKRLYIYGTVKYEDAFGTRRQTRFCQAIIWLKNDTFMGLNTSKYNDAN